MPRHKDAERGQVMSETRRLHRCDTGGGTLWDSAESQDRSSNSPNASGRHSVGYHTGGTLGCLLNRCQPCCIHIASPNTLPQ
jgi:hypothetical protein